MTPSLASSLDALGGWRAALSRGLDELGRCLADHDPADTAPLERLRALRQRLASEKLVVAFVAEFSRGKSELINAIFFADAGRRVLPAAPGRTTMCPVELGFEAGEPPSLALLPIDTRLTGASLAELRQQPRAWTRTPLVAGQPAQLAHALTEVMRTQCVSVEMARQLGFWDDERPDDNPPRVADGLVEVPAWRHAVINYPHPLLQRGLVVLDTPGLNAIGAEPELTLSLLPSAHATVFVLGADTGVTRSDLEIWRDHLSAQPMPRYVVLNKIDALRDPLSSAAEVEAQIEAQRQATARVLGVPADRVFPLSARQALAARVGRDDAAALAGSRLPAFEAALVAQLLPQRRHLLAEAVTEGVTQIESDLARRLGDRRRQTAEQMLELRGLRGKSAAKLRVMLGRIDAETAEFEQCITRLQALRSVHHRMTGEALESLSGERLREEIARMQVAMDASLFRLGARSAFVALCQRLHQALDTAQGRAGEIRDMLAASFTRLNGEFGFALALPAAPELDRFKLELDLIQRNYEQYLGLTHALKLSRARFMEQFCRMLLSKLRAVFESACGDIEQWNKGISAQVDLQLRERRNTFGRRREALERIQAAAGELEQRIGEIERNDERLQQFQGRMAALVDKVKQQAAGGSAASAARDPATAPARLAAGM